jgi:CheY-like chemotaxis protein
VRSSPGKGATFTFSVPLRPVDVREEAVRAPEDAPPPGLRVLAAEDVPTNQLLIETLLKQDGHDCRLVGNGREAVEALQRDCFDVVLMDVQMPEMDGVEATRRIRQMPGSAGRTPVIFVTANAMAGDEARYLAAGASAYIAKPIQRKALRECLARLATSAAR